MPYKFQLGAARLSGSLTQEGAVIALDSNLSASNSIVIGNADLDETDLEKLDGITNGTVAANKAIVVDASKDFSGYRNMSGSGVLQNVGNAIFGGNLNVSGNTVNAGNLTMGGTLNAGDISQTGDLTIDGNVSGSGTLQMVGATILGNTLNVTGAATFASSVTAGTSFIIGSADLNEADMEKIDGITNGTVAANKAIVVGANKDFSGHRNMSGSGVLQNVGNVIFGGNLNVSGNTINAGNLTMGGQLNAGDIAQTGDLTIDGNVSGSGTLQMVGATVLGNTLNVSGAATFAAGLVPAAANGAALGSAAKEWSDLYLHDGGIVYFGADQDVRLEHVTDSGLNLHSKNDGGTNATSLIMNFSSSSPADNDEIGKIAFKAFNDNEQNETFAQILVKSTDVSDGSEDASMTFAIFEGGSPTEYFNIGGTDQTMTIEKDVVMAGNLTINGTTTSVNSTTINITSSFTFEGTTPNAHETILGVVNPTADTTINLPALSAGTYHLPVLTGVTTQAAAAVTPAEFALLDGASTISAVTVVDGDGVLFNDGGTMKQVRVQDLRTYMGADDTLTVNSAKTNGDDLESGVNFFASSSIANTVVDLPEDPDAGTQVFVKAMSNCGIDRLVTIQRKGSNTIDGVSSIVLESPNAAIQCIFIGNNEWKIF